MKCDPVWARLGETVCKYMHKPLIPYLFTGAGTHPSRRVATVSADAGAESITHTHPHTNRDITCRQPSKTQHGGRFGEPGYVEQIRPKARKESHLASATRHGAFVEMLLF